MRGFADANRKAVPQFRNTAQSTILLHEAIPSLADRPKHELYAHHRHATATISEIRNPLDFGQGIAVYTLAKCNRATYLMKRIGTVEGVSKTSGTRIL